MPIYGLIDANSFYCSCQRVFEARIRTAPVVVLSNNDGCAIARTKEAKQLGIKMGDAWHLIRQRPDLKGVQWYSSNYPLYADMSRRMYQVLESRVPRVEPYSIDEMFLDLSGLPYDLPAFCRELRDEVRAVAKIPTCIGWGPTKTIAKLANGIAKDRPELDGVCDLSREADRQAYFRELSIGEVWGIGRRTAEKLQRAGIQTIADFVAMDSRAARSMLTVVGARVQAELRGQSCLPLSEVAAPRQGLACTRTFGRLVDNWTDLREAVSHYATTAAEKLRAEGMTASFMTVFIQTNPHQKDTSWYANQQSCGIEPTSDTLVLITEALRLLRRIWKPGYRYFKAGVMLDGLCPAGMQTGLFQTRDPVKSSRLMDALDAVNGRYGRGTVRPLSNGLDRTWRARQAMLSPAYTTRLQDIMEVKAW